MACGWVLFVDALTPASRVEIMRSHALITFLEVTATAAFLRHFPLKYYWFVLLNAFAYALIGLGIELLRRHSLRHVPVR